MKIKTLLYSVIGMTVSLFIVSVICCIFLFLNIQKQKDAYDIKTHVLSLEVELIDASDRLTSDARAYINTNNISYYNSYQTEVNETQTRNKVMADLDEILPDGIAVIAENVVTESNKLAELETEAFNLMTQNDQRAANELIYSDAYYAGKETINSYFAELEQQVISWTNTLLAETKRSVTISFTILISFLILFFISNVLSVLYIMRKMKTLYVLTDQAQTLANGDLTINKLQIAEKSQDEISQLSRSFNAMFDNLRNIITTLSKSSIDLSASSEELVANANQSADAIHKVNHSIKDMANGSAEQLNAITESSQAMSEVATGIQHIASTASDVVVSSELASTRAQDGGKRLNEAVTQMKEIESVVTETMESIYQLSARSKEIENIVDAITEIADQTNLLALNAAIEAARAGDAGKGFAVVADEVRKLAEESNKSAQQIATIIHSIQNDTNTTVTKMTKVNETVLSGVESMSITGESFKEIISSSQDVTDQIQEVSAVSQQIAASAQQVSATFETMQDISFRATQVTNEVVDLSQEQLGATEEITAATNLLNGLATELNYEVSKFKV